MKAAILILSDKGSRGERVDGSGPALEEWLTGRGATIVKREMIPDDAGLIERTLRKWADSGTVDLLVTCGGTGLSPRDVTPDATRRVLDREIPGLGEEMRRASAAITPHALLSRAIAGVRKSAMIVNLPGSPKGAIENLAAIWPAIPHGVAKLQGDPADCADSRPAHHHAVPAVSFVARSGTGKTTLLEKVIPLLKERGWRVGVVKHDAHRFDIDHPGKDSHRLTAAGADTMLICSAEKLALVKRHEAAPPIRELLATYFTDVDIVLTEGFKQSDLPKIEVNRKEQGETLICRGETHDPALIAVASDGEMELDVPRFDIDDAPGIASFLEKQFLPRRNGGE
ncbi:molybdopterin-guanine dinucleotide biosynthesis protein B [Geomobilimonas luticola]